MTASHILNNVVRTAGGIALVLGLFLWGDRLRHFADIHMALGGLAILSLWILAVLALRRRASQRLAAFAFIWGVATLALGAFQTSLLVGDAHWIVEVAHLLLGVGAIAIGAVLARSATRVSAL